MDLPVPGAGCFFSRITSPAVDHEDFGLPITADKDVSQVRTQLERCMDYRQDEDFIAELAR